MNTTFDPTTEAIALRQFELMAGGAPEDFAALIHPDCVNHEAKDEPPAARGTGPHAIHATAVWLRDAFSDLRWEVDEAFPPTGKCFAVTQTHWIRVTDGKMIEHWANRDDLGMAKQCGWVPPTPGYLLRMALAKLRAR